MYSEISCTSFPLLPKEQLQQQLIMDKEMRSKVADTVTRQVYFEKELTQAIGNIIEEEDKLEERLRGVEEKLNLNRERNLRMNDHWFTLIEDVVRLKDILEAVVTDAVTTRHAAYLSANADLSKVASF
jgi:hypothetical protein